MKFIDMFCGIGGFRYGLEKVRIQGQQDSDQHISCLAISIKEKQPPSRDGAESAFGCVWANDNDKYACQIYRKHWDDGTLYEGDIRAVDADAIPEHDLLCAGFPCQSFSIAGKRRGFEDTRGTLFFDICRVLRAKRPSYLLLENVKGLLSHDDGLTFQTIIGTLDELGYDYQWGVLNSKDFGVPQNRERVFIVGHTRGKPRPKVFPLGEADKVYPELATCLDANYGKGWLNHGQRTMIFDVYNQQLRANQDLAGALKGEGIADTSIGTALLESQKIRRLTPLECERLQGFPDGWTEGISDTQRYKCLGNAVTVNVIEAIGRQMLMELDFG